MASINFSEQEVANLVNILAQTKDFPWLVTNPLISKLAPHMPKGPEAKPMPEARQMAEQEDNGLN